jgi:RHS repeat-associated protein
MIALLSYDGGFYWLHTDHLGSGRKITNTSGTVVYRGEFDPHGQALYEWHSSGQTYLNSHKYTGYERDWATNLNYAKARTYHHNRGRFMQPDPLGLGAADVTNPQSLNRYSYVQNDPVNFTDPLGLFRICFWRIEERSGWDGDTYYVNRPVLVFDGCIDFDGGVYEPVGGSGGGGGGQGGSEGGNQDKDKDKAPPIAIDATRQQNCEKAIEEGMKAVKRYKDKFVKAAMMGQDQGHYKKMTQIQNQLREVLSSINSNCNNHNKTKYAAEIAEISQIVAAEVPPVGWKEHRTQIQTMKVTAAVGSILGAIGAAGRAVWDWVWGTR